MAKPSSKDAIGKSRIVRRIPKRRPGSVSKPRGRKIGCFGAVRR